MYIAVISSHVCLILLIYMYVLTIKYVRSQLRLFTVHMYVRGLPAFKGAGKGPKLVIVPLGFGS